MTFTMYRLRSNHVIFTPRFHMKFHIQILCIIMMPIQKVFMEKTQGKLGGTDQEMSKKKVE